jgi:hypothetical protein
MVEDMMRFVELLRERHDLRVRVDATVFPGEYHATVAPVTLTHGLRHVFGQG